MGTPAVSFYAGKVKLGVDRSLEEKKTVYFSRDPSDILYFVLKANKKQFDNRQSKEIQSGLFSTLDKIIFN